MTGLGVILSRVKHCVDRHLGFSYAGRIMAREIKKVELKTVDDTAVDKGQVFRLNPGFSKVEPEPLIRIEPAQEPSTKLEVGKIDPASQRSYEPGIEALIEQEPLVIEESESNWGDAKSSKLPLPWGWFALVGAVLLSAVLWSLSNLNQAKPQLDQIKVTTQALIAEEDVADKDAKRTVENVENALQHFCEATSIEELLPVLRDAERVRPLMENYYAKNRFAILGDVEIKALQPLTLGRRANFWVASIQTVSGMKKNILMEETASGEVQVDWETYVCYQPMPWGEFVTNRPGGTSLDFRVYANPDQFFSHEFNNSEQWDCYRLTALDSEETLFGYAQAGSETAEILENHFQIHGANPSALILRLRLPEGLESRRGVVIEKVLSSRWLYIEAPDDDS